MPQGETWVEQTEEGVILRQGIGADNSVLLTISPTNRVIASPIQAAYLLLFEKKCAYARKVWGFGKTELLQKAIFAQDCQELQLTMGQAKNSREAFIEAQKAFLPAQIQQNRDKGVSL